MAWHGILWQCVRRLVGDGRPHPSWERLMRGVRQSGKQAGRQDKGEDLVGGGPFLLQCSWPPSSSSSSPGSLAGDHTRHRRILREHVVTTTTTTTSCYTTAQMTCDFKSSSSDHSASVCLLVAVQWSEEAIEGRMETGMQTKVGALAGLRGEWSPRPRMSKGREQNVRAEYIHTMYTRYMVVSRIYYLPHTPTSVPG